MIKIISAHENPGDDTFPPSVHLLIEIDGYQLHVGGIDPAWDRDAILQYLNNDYDSLLSQAMQAQPTEGIEKRYDLVDAEGLPDSEHPAKLIAVNPALAKPATVRRWHGGIAYDVNCLVSQNIVDMWLANPKELNIGDWVLVSFLDELTATDEKHIAIVTDKIFESWG